MLLLDLIVLKRAKYLFITKKQTQFFLNISKESEDHSSFKVVLIE